MWGIYWTSGQILRTNPTKQGIKTIFSAANRMDIFEKYILEKKEAIVNGSLKVKFHQICRKTYASIQNITCACISQFNDREQDKSCSKKTRSNMGVFDIRRMCLICNKSGYKKINQKKEKLTSV